METVDNAAKIFDRLDNTPIEVMQPLTDPIKEEVTQPVVTDNVNDDEPGGFFDLGNHTKVEEKPPLTDKPNIDFKAAQPKTGTQLGNIVGGAVAVSAMDFVMPAIVVYICKQISKKEVDAELLLLNKEDKEMLEPLMDNFLKYVDINLENPATALAFGLIVVYGSKSVEATKRSRIKTTERRDNFNDKSTGKTTEKTGKRAAHPSDCKCVVCKQQRKKQAQ